MTENLNNQAAPIYVDRQKVDMFLMTHQKYFPAEKIVFIREKMYTIDESKFMLLSAVELKDPTTMLLISLFLGVWGVDRFVMKETGMGVLKLLTCGCCGVLTIMDWISIQKKTKERNFNDLMARL